jgi:DNA-directed RNA polymerase subunit L
MELPNIEIEWMHYKELDEIHLDDLTPFNILLLTLVKGDEVQLVAYDIEEKKWGILQEKG